jgi:hypothetical protein
MAFHIEVIADRAVAAYAETVEATTGIQVFGMANNGVLAMLERQAGVGVPLSVKPYHLGGFTRHSDRVTRSSSGPVFGNVTRRGSDRIVGSSGGTSRVRRERRRRRCSG